MGVGGGILYCNAPGSIVNIAGIRNMSLNDSLSMKCNVMGW